MKGYLILAAVVGIGYLGFTGKLNPLITRLTDPDGKKARISAQKKAIDQKSRKIEVIEDPATKESFMGL